MKTNLTKKDISERIRELSQMQKENFSEYREVNLKRLKLKIESNRKRD